MFKEFIVLNTQTSSSPQKIGFDLTQITYYHRNGAENRIRIGGIGMPGYDLYMTETDFNEFLTNLKTANRLKKAYE